VLIDFENVQPKNLGLLTNGPFKVKVFLGSNQAKIPRAMAIALQPFGADVEYIEVEGNGSNALDFHIAYYVGRLAAKSADVFFHIISNDKGFDPLIKHLKGQNIFCQRSASVADIPMLKNSNAKTATNKIDAAIDHLERWGSSRPKTLKTLGSTLKAFFVNRFSDDEIEMLINQLTQRGVVMISDGKVNYQLSSQ